MEPIQQPTPEPAANTTPATTPAPAAQPQQTVQPIQAHGSKGLAITSLVLGIASVVLAIVWFVSIPLAITAIVLGIVSLVKKRAGKGMSITGLVTGAVTLFVIIPLVLLTVIAYTGIQERSLQYEQETRIDQSESLFN